MCMYVLCLLHPAGWHGVELSRLLVLHYKAVSVQQQQLWRGFGTTEPVSR